MLLGVWHDLQQTYPAVCKTKVHCEMHIGDSQRTIVCRQLLTDTAFHLELDQTVHLNRIFHRQFLREWLDEAHDDHLSRF